MKRRLIFFLLGLCPFFLNAQNIHSYHSDSFKVGHLLDSAYKKNNIYTELSLGAPGGYFTNVLGGPEARSFALTLETNFRAGFFPVKKFLIGWDFTPYITFSNLGIESFRWSTGPFVRYYFPFYRVTRNKELKSPFSVYVFFNFNFGQYNPAILDRPFDARWTAGISAGIGFNFKLKKNLCLNIELGPRYDFFAAEFEHSRFNTLFKIGLSYSFPSKRDIAKKKYRRLTN